MFVIWMAGPGTIQNGEVVIKMCGAAPVGVIAQKDQRWGCWPFFMGLWSVHPCEADM